MILSLFLREPRRFEKTCRTQRSNSLIQVISQLRHTSRKLPQRLKTSSPRMVFNGVAQKVGSQDEGFFSKLAEGEDDLCRISVPKASAAGPRQRDGVRGGGRGRPHRAAARQPHFVVPL